jgi:hypothetical protein
MSVLACGLLNKDKKDSSEELKKKELELKEKELALEEKKEQIMREREERQSREERQNGEERLSREQEDLSSPKKYIEREKTRNRDDRSRTNKKRIETDYSNYQPGSYPEASTRYLTYNDLKNKSRWQLKIMRNEIYARHGFIFQTREMKNYFNNQSWYNPVYNNVSHMLTSIEKSNIAYIKKFE